ncbi:hypothetical protein [Bradyrhizobium acaciae]|uniref:hypothetical protein n=1 Tax=Bradyrhizobium acaciae TaxID=2683706 RepID=UPI003B82C75E
MYDRTNEAAMSTNKHNCSRTVAPAIIIHKDQGCILFPMPIFPRPIPVLTALALAACALGGCSSVNQKLSAGMADTIPAWAGGLPADAPPRAGTPEYDKFMQERERKRLMPAAERGDDGKPATPAQNAAH